MTATTSAPQRPLDGQGPGQIRVATVPRQRRVSWMVLGVFLVVGGALLFAVLAVNLSARTPVLVMARTVPAGQVITADDVKVVQIAADGGVRAIAASRRNTVVGRTAATDLAPGMLITRDHVGTGTGLERGKALVGVALSGGQFHPDLGQGDTVNVIYTGDVDNPPRVIALGRVTKIEETKVNAVSAFLISLSVPENDAPAVTGAVNDKKLALAAVSSR